jgi:hypothetical protein
VGHGTYPNWQSPIAELTGRPYLLSLPNHGVYTRPVTAHIIGNPVPTPEEMGTILGLSSEHVAAVRRIMSTPAKEKLTDRLTMVRRTAARKKSTPTR